MKLLKCLIHISGKITTVPRLFFEHLLQNENTHQIMNLHTKWDYLIPIFSSSFRDEIVSYKCPIRGKITTISRLLTEHFKLKTSDYECTHQMLECAGSTGHLPCRGSNIHLTPLQICMHTFCTVKKKVCVVTTKMYCCSD